MPMLWTWGWLFVVPPEAQHRWWQAVCGSSSWSPTQEVTSDTKFTDTKCHFKMTCDQLASCQTSQFQNSKHTHHKHSCQVGLLLNDAFQSRPALPLIHSLFFDMSRISLKRHLGNSKSVQDISMKLTLLSPIFKELSNDTKYIVVWPNRCLFPHKIPLFSISNVDFCCCNFHTSVIQPQMWTVPQETELSAKLPTHPKKKWLYTCFITGRLDHKAGIGMTNYTHMNTDPPGMAFRLQCRR